MNRPLKILIILACIVVLGIAAFVLIRGQPLLPSRDYKLTVLRNGSPAVARLMHPPALSGQYYIALSDPPSPLYRWFHIDFPRRRVTVGDGVCTPELGPEYLRLDQLGIGLPSMKLEDAWTVNFKSATEVQLNGATLSITLTPQ